ncbi:MAG TPA: TonB-dependent receptor [Woeseiaceae bacterium]|nr:TonB-dependent receptor [Woeseiaceae bacterium]
MKTQLCPWRTALGWSLVVAGLSLSTTAFSQEDDVVDDDNAVVEEITVTGSKIKRDAFSSISPVQVLGGQDSLRIGTVDPSQMIAESPFVTGTQLDGSTNSSSSSGATEGVPATGPGAASVSLRGLGAERTLLLVNGRRLSPSGVRGAPVAPDLNLIPAAMIDRIEILTDGASSIYGADAVAGVANIILRTEFEGIELNAFGTAPEQGGGEETLISLMGGASNDRSSFMLAAEYFNRETIFAGDRTDWNSCHQGIEVAPDGTVYKHCQDNRPDNAGATTDDPFGFAGFGFVFNTPGTTDLGVPGWSTGAGATQFLGRTPGDGSGDYRVGSASETPYNLQQELLDTQLMGNIERINIYATGRYDFSDSQSVYMEGSYTQRQNFEHFTDEQVYPSSSNWIPMEDANGDLMRDAAGELLRFDNPMNPFDYDPANPNRFARVVPVYTLAALPQVRDVDVDNVRFVVGLDGSLGSGGWFEDRGWSYDAFASYEESSGTSIAPGINENHVLMSVDTLRLDVDGNPICGTPRRTGSFGFTTQNECVPVNWFAPSLFTVDGIGNKRFATQAEEDWLFGNVLNQTSIKQQHYSALATGELFDMPAGPAAMAIGVEYRVNSIDSNNDFLRANGLAASEATDVEGDTVGETWIGDLYAELEMPLFDSLLVNLSGRYTEEKNFGDETTWSAKVLWRPVDQLSIRATVGTTFRAPNLREQFLAGQAGVLDDSADPCVVPNTAIVDGDYVPALDTRSARVLANCNLDGADPTTLGLSASVLIPTNTGGSDDIRAETSESYTVGFVWSPTIDAFGLDVGLTYFNYDVEDTVEELNSTDILRRCYNDEDNLASAFCNRVERRGGATPPDSNTVQLVDASFVNLGLVTSKGYDMNIRYLDDFDMFGSMWDVQATWTGTMYDELGEQIDSESPFNDRVGEAGFPEFSWIARFDVSTGNWIGTWRTRYVSDFEKDPEDINASGNDADVDPCATLGGPDDCVEKSFGPSKIYHDLSATYQRDTWAVTLGIKNVFDEMPPLVNQNTDEAPSRFNYVVQSAYDLYGRRAFLNLSKSF